MDSRKQTKHGDKIESSFFWRKELLLPAVFITQSLCLPWNPMSELLFGGRSVLTEQASGFDRKVGMAIKYGIDVSMRVRNMRIWGFFVIPVLFLLTYGILYFSFAKRQATTKEGFVFAAKFSTLGLPALLIATWNRLDPAFSTMISPLPILLLIFSWLYTKYWSNIISLQGFSWTICVALSLVPFGISLIYFFAPQLLQDIVIKIFMLCLTTSVIFALVIWAVLWAGKNGAENQLCSAFLPLAGFSILSSVCIELYLITNQHGILLPAPSICLIFLLCVFFPICGFRYRKVRQRKEMKSGAFAQTKLCYALLIFGVALFLSLPAPIQYANEELFEMSNHGSDV